MNSQELDFYLEDISESGYNTNYIKNKRNVHANQRFHVRKNSTQRYYEYRIDKICQYKSALKCTVVSCSARLAVLFGESIRITYPKIGFVQTVLYYCSINKMCYIIFI